MSTTKNNITPEVDWSIAPEWATHAIILGVNWDADPECVGKVEWAMLTPDGYYTWDGAKRGEYYVMDEGDGKFWGVLEERPKEWNGEGLPPVGCECEYKYISSPADIEWKWHKCKILFSGKRCVVFENSHGDELANNSSVVFRPIQKDPREKVLKELIYAVTYGRSKDQAIKEALEKLTNLPPF